MLNLENTIERFKILLTAKDDVQIREEFEKFHNADIAEIFEGLTEEERLYFFNLLDESEAAELLEFLSPQIQVELLSDLDEEKAGRIILKMPHDNLADVLGDLEDVDSETYLNKLPERVSNQIRELLSYPEDSAGGIMNSDVITVDKDMTVDEVVSFLRIKAQTDKVELYYVYVTDKVGHLLGVLSLRSLFTTPTYVKVEDIMITDLVKVHVDEDQEVAAETLSKYGILAVPVVDHYGKLKGIVTWDDAQDVVEEETTEEILQASGIATNDEIDEEEILEGPIYQAIRARTPWLLITLAGEFIAVNVAKHFSITLDAMPIIAIFMPLLAGLGGNIGTQSITLMVRGLSTGQVTMGSAVYHIFREAKIGLLIGVVFGALVTLSTFGWQHNIALGIIVGLSMAINMTMATIIGTVTPFMLKKINIDPAVASGPVIATTIDVMGLTVYFSLVTISLGWLLAK
ncbi:MAG: magnesium transporter [Candidatus Gastranaerophilales bacterium]|nr:magnesium transporter [Candidatus Gastranaerophilales bacterium]